MAKAASSCAEPAAGTKDGQNDDDTKTTMSNGYAELLGVCDLSASSSDSEDSSNSKSNGSGKSSSSSSGNASSSSDSSSDSSDEDDGSGSETVDVVGDDAPAASPGVEKAKAAPSKICTQPESEDTDADDDQVVSVGNAGSVTPDIAVKVPHVTLVNKAQFLPKMQLQVGPQGRLMQPAPIVRFSNLLDELQYVVWISFIQDSGVCAGEYMHPESPRPGTSWNGKPLSFSKLKLFSYDGISKTPITLICNKSYFLQINFGTVDEYGRIMESTVIRQAIVGTWFIAVNHNHTKALVSSSKKSSHAYAPATNKWYKSA